MSNQLEMILKESGLDAVKADLITKNFEICFELAADWATIAKTIIVKSADQKADIELAREGRLILRDKRIAIEKTRVKMKEDILKEGRAIDAVAKKLTALITPIEDYLDQQEHFVQIEQEKKDAAHRAEVERRMAEEDAQRAKEESEKAEKLRVENEKLKAEAAEKDRLARYELAEQEKKLDAEKAKNKAIQDKADAEKAALEVKAKEKENKEKQRLAEAKAKTDAERAEKERLQDILDGKICCPKCKFKFKLEK